VDWSGYLRERHAKARLTGEQAAAIEWLAVELYRYVEYPAMYHKDRVIGHLRATRAGETEEQSRARGGRDIATLLDSPFFDVWAQAGIAEILSALHERLVTSAQA
jgi:hypothetical protein